MHNQIKSGGVPQGFARLPIRARKLSRSTFLLLLLVFSCQKIDLTPEAAPVPDGSDLTDTLPTEIIKVEAIPTPCTLWQGHIVALVESVTTATGSPATAKPAPVPEGPSSAPVPELVGEPVESSPSAPVPDGSPSGSKASPLVLAEALVTLLSLHEWSNLPSALHATNPTEASTLARGYQEYDLTHWRIPTATQAKALKAAYPAAPVSEGPPFATVPEESSSGITGINALLLQAEGLPLTPDARYLCEEGTKSFSFAPGTTLSTAGTKATTYRLRLVKTLHLKQKP